MPAAWSGATIMADAIMPDVTAETADTFGLQVLGVGAAVFAAGWVLGKVSGEK